nr:HEPN domain-containing protein [uncultured Duganella sp.]
MRRIEQTNPELASRICELLPEIDQVLNSVGTKLSSRPMEATTALLDGCVTVKNGSMDQPYLQDWFAVLFAIVKGWYERKYAAALNAKTATLKGLIEIHGLPFILNVPENYGVKDQENGHCRLCFDPTLGESETPRKWIMEPPALESLTQRQSHRLDRDLKSITKTLRTINVNLMLGDPGPDRYKSFCSTALISICNAAEKISLRNDAHCSSAVWEIYFAVENMLKALIAQRGAQPDFDHSLSHLLNQAKMVGVEINQTLNFGFLPSPFRAIDYRYGARFPGGYKKVLVMHQKALPLLLDLSSKVQRTVTFGDGAAIILRRPPWFKFLDD